MDFRIESVDGATFFELRDARRVDAAGRYRALVCVGRARRVERRSLWFDRGDLEEFLSEARWLERSAGGAATLDHRGRQDRVALRRDGAGWWVEGEVFRPSDRDEHLRFRLAVEPQAARSMIGAFAALAARTEGGGAR